MATSTISNDVLNPTVADFTVTATLLPGAGFRIDSNTEVLRQVSTTATGGTWSLALERQANITPASSWWEIREDIPTANGGPRAFAISVGSSNATLQASLITPSQNPALAAYLTQAAADARYLQTGSFLPVNADGIQYLSKTGSDSNTGLSLGQAKLTLAAAVAALPSGTHGTIFAGAGTFSYSSQLDVSDLASLTCIGQGSMGYPATEFRYTGTGSTSAAKLGSSYGFRSSGIWWSYSSSSFTGILLDFSKLVSSTWGDTIFSVIENGRIGANPNSIHSAQLITYARSDQMKCSNVYFSGGTQGVRGRVVEGDFSNIVTLENCWFDNMFTAAIVDPYTGWNAIGCNFQPLVSGASGILIMSAFASRVALGIKFIGCSGQDGVGGTMFVWDAGQGFEIDGGYYSGDNTTTIFKFNANNTKGVSIGGGVSLAGGVGVDFASTTGHLNLSIGVSGWTNNCVTAIANLPDSVRASATNLIMDNTTGLSVGAIGIGAGQKITKQVSGAKLNYDPPSLLTGTATTTTITVSGATTSGVPQVVVSADAPLLGVQLTGYVNTADTVTVTLTNATAGTIDLAALNLRATATYYT